MTDPAARNSAYMTVCQTAFTLAFRKVNLPAEMGNVDLFDEAALSAQQAGPVKLAALIRTIAAHERNYGNDRLATLLAVSGLLATFKNEIEPWLLVELQSRSAGWLQALEDQAERIPLSIHDDLPPLYALFVPHEAEARAARLRQKTIRAMSG